MGLNHAKGTSSTPASPDVTLTNEIQIVPFIDGINSVKRISELADADYTLTKKCIEHLLSAPHYLPTPLVAFRHEIRMP